MAKRFTRFFLAVSTVLWVAAAIADEHGHMHHAFPKDIDAFHATLAPVWHARAGKARSQNACAKAAEMATLAKDIQSADATALVGSVAALQSTCKRKAKLAEVDAALSDVHEAFHHLIDAKPAATR